MKKIALFIVVAASLAACTKWENKSTEFKVTGVWTGINTQIDIKAFLNQAPKRVLILEIQKAGFILPFSLFYF